MNKVFLGGLVLGCLTIASSTATAQSFRLKASIPFEFNIGSASFPAGDYIISKSGSASHLVFEDSESGRYRSVVMVAPAAHSAARPPRDDSSLVFARVQNRYYFRQAWRSGEPLGVEASVGRFEKQAMLQAGNQPERVVLRASLK